MRRCQMFAALAQQPATSRSIIGLSFFHPIVPSRGWGFFTRPNKGSTDKGALSLSRHDCVASARTKGGCPPHGYRTLSPLVGSQLALKKRVHAYSVCLPEWGVYGPDNMGRTTRCPVARTGGG